MTGADGTDSAGAAERVAAGLRQVAMAVAGLPRTLQPALGRRLAHVADLAKRDVVAAEQALARLRRRVEAAAGTVRRAEERPEVADEEPQERPPAERKPLGGKG